MPAAPVRRLLVAALCLPLLAPAASWADGTADLQACDREVFGSKSDIGDSVVGDANLAMTFCTRAIESGELTGGSLAKAYFDRAVVQLTRRVLDRAVADFDQAIRLYPGYSAAYQNRAQAHAGLGEYEQAIADYDALLKLEPASHDAYYYRGLARFALARYADAASDFARKLELDPADAYAAIWLYLARLRSGGQGRAELQANAARLSLDRWPGPVVKLYLGQMSAGDVTQRATASSADPQQDALCEAHFYYGEILLASDVARRQLAIDNLRAAAADCPEYFIERDGAKAELKRLGE